MSRGHVIIVEDDAPLLRTLSSALEDEGWTAAGYGDRDAALDGLGRDAAPDVVLTDLRLGRGDGMELFARIHERDPELPVIVMTAFGSIAGALDAVRRGAFHYLTKPFKLDEMLLYVERAAGHRRLLREHARLLSRDGEADPTAALVGSSPATQALRDAVRRYGAASAAVLVVGETGTGKELVARALHGVSPRASGPFVAVNCSAIPETLMEAELFGHEKGTFTGAERSRAGLLEEASGGTLFLDEIGDMPGALQAKLLRVLQVGAVRRIGSAAEVPVDIRVVAATHRDLAAEVQAGRFREDLYWRLNVLPIRVPALRERRDDIPLLALHFLARATPRGTPVPRVRPEALELITHAPWRGNVRELENAMTRLSVLCAAGEIRASDLVFLSAADPSPLEAARAALPTLAQVEEDYIRWVLDRAGGNRTRAAQILGIDASTLYRRLGPARS